MDLDVGKRFRMGWAVFRIWEHELKVGGTDQAMDKLRAALDADEHEA